MIASSEASPSAETSRFNASLERGEESILAYRPQRRAARAAPSNPSHIEPFPRHKHPKRGKSRQGASPSIGAFTHLAPRYVRQSPFAAHALTACTGRATSFAHEHDQIDLRVLRLRARQQPSVHACGEDVRPHPRRERHPPAL